MKKNKLNRLVGHLPHFLLSLVLIGGIMLFGYLGNIYHTVQEGESLWTIATQHYNDGSQWVRFDREDPNLILPGEVIKIPIEL